MKPGLRCSVLGRGKQLTITSLACRDLAHNRLERRDTAGDGQKRSRWSWGVIQLGSGRLERSNGCKLAAHVGGLLKGPSRSREGCCNGDFCVLGCGWNWLGEQEMGQASCMGKGIQAGVGWSKRKTGGSRWARTRRRRAMQVGAGTCLLLLYMGWKPCKGLGGSREKKTWLCAWGREQWGNVG